MAVIFRKVSRAGRTAGVGSPQHPAAVAADVDMDFDDDDDDAEYYGGFLAMASHGVSANRTWGDNGGYRKCTRKHVGR